MEVDANVKWVLFLHTDVLERSTTSLNINKRVVAVMDMNSVLCEAETEVFYVV